MKSAQLIGYFVEPGVWVKMVVGKVNVTQTSGCVLILANVIKGTQKDKLPAHMRQILLALIDPNILHIADVSFLGFLRNKIDLSIQK